MLASQGQRAMGISFLPKWWRQCTEKNAFLADCYKLEPVKQSDGWISSHFSLSLSLSLSLPPPPLSFIHTDDLSSAHALLCPLSGGAPPFPFLKAVMAIGTGVLYAHIQIATNSPPFKIFSRFNLQIQDLMCVSAAVATATMSLHTMPAFSLTRSAIHKHIYSKCNWPVFGV